MRLHFLQKPFDRIAVGPGTKMRHDNPHGLHLVFKTFKIDILLDPGFNLFRAGQLGQISEFALKV